MNDLGHTFVHIQPELDQENLEDGNVNQVTFLLGFTIVIFIHRLVMDEDDLHCVTLVKNVSLLLKLSFENPKV